MSDAFDAGTLVDANFIENIHAGSQGFKVRWHEQRCHHPKTFSFLADAMKDQVLGMGYRLYMSDVRHFERNGYAEVMERHYLKPPLSAESPANQMFGNVLIENRLIDGRPYEISCQVSIYADRAYRSALPYPIFLEALCVT